MKTRLFVTTLGCLAILPVAVQAEDISYTYFDGAYYNNGLDVSATESVSETIIIDSEITVDFDGDMNIAVRDGEGFALRGSWAFHPNWHAFADYVDHDLELLMSMSGTITEIEAPPADFDLSAFSRGDITDWRAGLGYHHFFTPDFTAYAQVSWDSRKVDFDSMTATLNDPTGLISVSDVIDDSSTFDVDEDGLGAKVGLRGYVTDWLELNGHVRYSEIGGVNLMADLDSEDVIDSDTWFGVGAVVEVTDSFAVLGEYEAGDDSSAWGLMARMYFDR